MWKYCLDTKTCRRVWLLSYFGEHFDAADCNNKCDNCARANGLLMNRLQPAARKRSTLEIPEEVKEFISTHSNNSQLPDQRHARRKKKANLFANNTLVASSIQRSRAKKQNTNDDESLHPADSPHDTSKLKAKIEQAREKARQKMEERRQKNQELFLSSADEVCVWRPKH